MSAKTTWNPALARRGPIKPRPMLPAPKWMAVRDGPEDVSGIVGGGKSVKCSCMKSGASLR